MKAITKKILKVPYYLLLAGVAVIGLLLLSTFIPVPGNVKVKIVKSGSMEPGIKTGGIVVIKPADFYNVGDVITFGADTQTQIPTTHRIVEKNGSGQNTTFVTKGDANEEIDPQSVALSEVSGKVWFTIPYVGYILDFAKKPLGFFLLVGIPAGIVIFDEIAVIWQEVKKMKLKKLKSKNPKLKNRNISEDENSNEKFKENFSGSYVIDLRNRNISPSTKTIVAIIFVGASMFGFSKVGNTISYYQQSETSFNNRLQASSDFGLPNREVQKVEITLVQIIAEIPSEETAIEETLTKEDQNSSEEIVSEDEASDNLDETIIEVPAEV